MSPKSASSKTTKSSSSSYHKKVSRISRDEVLGITEALKKIQYKDKTFIAVCEERQSLYALPKHHGGSIFKSGSDVYAATCTTLDKIVDKACKQAKKGNTLYFLVSSYVTAVDFDIPSKMKGVTVQRCSSKSRAHSDGQLIISSGATFCGVLIREWLNRPEEYKYRELFFGYGTDVFLDTFSDDDEFMSTQEQTKLINEELRKLQSSDDSGNESVWEAWKGTIASVLGMLAGGFTFTTSLKISAAGLYFTPWFGAKLFGGYFTSSMIITASGSAAIAAAAVTATIYFIPWGKLFTYLRRLPGEIWSMLQNTWEWIKEKLSTLCTTMEDVDLPPSYKSAMSFQSA